MQTTLFAADVLGDNPKMLQLLTKQRVGFPHTGQHRPAWFPSRSQRQRRTGFSPQPKLAIER